MLKQIIKNLFSNWVGLLVSIVVAFLLAPFVVHSLGNTYYGIWAVIGQFSGYLYLFDFGIRESVIRYVAKHRALRSKGELESIIQTSFYVYLAIAMVCFVVLGLFAQYFGEIFALPEENWSEVSLTVFLIGGTVSQVFIFNVFTGVLMGFQRYDIFNVINLIGTLVRAAMFVWLLSNGYGIVALAAAQFLLSLTVGLILAIKAVRVAREAGIELNFEVPEWAQIKSTQAKLIRYGVYVLINNVGQKIIFMSDAILIGIFLPISQVTFYVIGATLVDYMRKLLAASAQIFNPLVSHFSALDQSGSVTYAYTAGSRLLLVIGIPIGLTLTILGHEFITLWMGPEYATLSGRVLIVLAIAQIASAPHQVVSSTLMGLNKHRALAFMRIVEAVANVALSIALIPRFGIIGVAIGTAVPHLLLTTIFLPIYASREVGIGYLHYLRESYLRPMAASVPFLLGCSVVSKYAPPSSLVEFFAIVLLLSALHVIATWFLVLSRHERKYLQEQLNSTLGRKNEDMV